MALVFLGLKNGMSQNKENQDSLLMRMCSAFASTLVDLGILDLKDIYEPLPTKQYDDVNAPL